MERGQGCKGLTLLVYPDKPDSYHPERHVNTLFTFPVPAAAFNRESWEEWLWGRIEDVENHERAEWFRFGEAGAPALQARASRRLGPLGGPHRRVRDGHQHAERRAARALPLWMWARPQRPHGRALPHRGRVAVPVRR
jgi:hypothetical protein